MENCGQPRWIQLEGAVNARVVVPGVLVRSDNLQSLSPSDVRRLVDQERVGVVLDLRTSTETQLEGPGPMNAETAVRIEHRSLHPETGGHTDVEAGTARPWQLDHADGFPDETPVVRAYLGYLAHRHDSIVAAISTIARADRAVLVHCAAGKDRTGVVVALALAAAGAGQEMIVRDYLASAERIVPIAERLLSSETYRHELEGQDPAAMAPRPGTMERVLEILEEHGGPAAWLLSRGLEAGDLARLRRRLGGSGAAAAAA